jgi:polysaccharide pyruvyl transferase WcaK-like protein
MPFQTNRPLKLCLFGAGLETGNLGVSALGLSVLSGIARRVDNPLITVFDDRRGVRQASIRVAGRDLRYRICGAIPTRRVYQRESLWRIRAEGWLGGFGNTAITALREADAVLDITGGDSFTDLYGPRRFRGVTLQKIITREQRRPLILLPQTIGPYASARRRRIAQRILRSAEAIWSRGQPSFMTLRGLLGDDFDPSRHRCGVDVAFALEAREPARPVPRELASSLSGAAGATLVGFNVSGLIFNQATAARRRYGLRADYRRAVTRFLERILRETDANILLVPHVLVAPGHMEHDPDACAAVAAAIRRLHDDRVAIVGDGYDPFETKWIISRTDWFCGTRMHAAIAALSSGVPAAALAYSEKTLGVFETCAQARHVADLRHLDTDDVVNRLWRSWASRLETKASLHRELPAVHAQAEAQMDEIVSRCAAPRASLA